MGDTGQVTQPDGLPGPPREPPQDDLHGPFVLRFTPYPPILRLPAEIIYRVFSYCHVTDICSAGATCRHLAEYANNDPIWSIRLRENMPSGPVPLPDPRPWFENYKQLYLAFKPVWFIVRNQIWITDDPDMGNLTVGHYNWRTGKIELSRTTIGGNLLSYDRWPEALSTIFGTFDPQIEVGKEAPVEALKPVNDLRSRSSAFPSSLEELGPQDNVVFLSSSLNTSRQLEHQAMQDELEPEIWPPIGIPSDYRTQVVDMQEWDNAEHDREMRLSATYRWPCEFLFRYKRLKQPTDILESSVPRWHVTTFASFNREVYTPTPDFPYRGLWVGNFSEIGPEFILFTQFHAPYMDGEIERVASSLFGIKLTREHGMSGSEVAFATHDTSSHGELRIAHENEISGTRVVLAEALNLDDGKFEDAELMLLSHDCVALHWIEDARLSVFKRVLPPKTPDWELGAE